MSTTPTFCFAAVLLAAIVVIMLTMARWPYWIRLVCQVAALALLSLLLVPLLGSPLAPSFSRPFGPTRMIEQLFAMGWWLLAARVAVLVARGAIAIGNRSHEARILSDLAAGAIQVAAVLGVIAFVFALPVRGLLATSGVIAIVLGLALQSTLGDLFSGIAVGAERPYIAGDTLTIDGITGTVMEINWRSTHLRVGHDLAIVPNSVVARARLVNRSMPLAATGEVIELKVDPAIPPESAVLVLEAAVLATRSLSPSFEGQVTCVALAGDGSTFALKFGAASSDAVGGARSELLARAHRHLRFAGMPLAVPGQASRVEAGIVAQVSIDDLLARSALFEAMSEQHRSLLASHFTTLELDLGDVLFVEGDQPEALFMVAAGVIEMATGPIEAPTSRYRLSPGETIGAVSLITGSPQRATGRSATVARLFRLDEAGLAAALADTPELAADLEQAVERAVRAMERQSAARGDATADAPDAFGRRLRSFLQRLLVAGRAR